MRKNEAPAADSADIKTQLAQMNEAIANLSKRLDSLVTDIRTLRTNEADPTAKRAPAILTTVPERPSDTMGKAVSRKLSAHDPQNGYVQDDALEAFKKALVVFEAGKYSDAVLQFSTFIKDNSDHPLSGSAQYYIGESYFKQGEFKLALEEFKKVILSYDHSDRLAESLSRLAECYDALKQPNEAQMTRQNLLASFPQTRAAKEALPKEKTVEPGPAPASSTAMLKQDLESLEKESRNELEDTGAIEADVMKEANPPSAPISTGE